MKLFPLSWLTATILYSLIQLTTVLAATTTTTIDDSAWNTHALQLSPGWNMLRPSQTESIDPFEVDLMRPLLPLFFNHSISWTRQKNANFTLSFTGSGITIFSPHGPSASQYSITLDGSPVPGTFDARAEVFTPNKTLWHREGLGKGEHTVVVRNEGEGYLYFDWAEVITSPEPTSEAPKSTASAPAAPAVVPMSLPYDPAALQRLTEIYHFKMNSRVYFVIILASTMLLLSLALILLHRHRHPTHQPQSRKSKSFINGPVPNVPKQPTQGALSALKRHLRKSKISNPVPHAPQGGYRPFEDEELVLAPQARKLRPRDVEDGSGAVEESGLSLADALRDDGSGGRGGRGKRVTRVMF